VAQLAATDGRRAAREGRPQFWTYTCINWLRTLAYVRAWAEKYKDQGLVVIGVHTPEFDVEHDLDHVRREVKDLGVDYPVAVDNDYRIWSAFDNHYWPALYAVDDQGRIRHHRFGEGGYEESEMILQQLLAEAGIGGMGQDLVSIDPGGGSRRRLGEPAIPRELPRLCTHPEFRIVQRCGAGYASRLRRLRAVATQPLGPRG
jgi:AhpC/TSA family